jgi:hypothetical protein
VKAACHRCGGIKAGPFLPCAECHHTPREADRALAWLCSSAHLNEEELALAAERIRGGEQPDPSPRLLAHAAANMAASRGGSGAPLSHRQLFAIGLGSLVLTPLVGLSIPNRATSGVPTGAARHHSNRRCNERPLVGGDRAEIVGLSGVASECPGNVLAAREAEPHEAAPQHPVTCVVIETVNGNHLEADGDRVMTEQVQLPPKDLSI